mmetsp:Transcript_19524/g.55937  ORF Transcript_19524/g.55937 Transcript_19524/m.55937 type:complete len:348 (+) Transcript_19524:398-1441(+)
MRAASGGPGGKRGPRQSPSCAGGGGPGLSNPGHDAESRPCPPLVGHRRGHKPQAPRAAVAANRRQRWRKLHSSSALRPLNSGVGPARRRHPRSLVPPGRGSVAAPTLLTLLLRPLLLLLLRPLGPTLLLPLLLTLPPGGCAARGDGLVAKPVPRHAPLPRAIAGVPMQPPALRADFGGLRARAPAVPPPEHVALLLVPNVHAPASCTVNALTRPPAGIRSHLEDLAEAALPLAAQTLGESQRMIRRVGHVGASRGGSVRRAFGLRAGVDCGQLLRHRQAVLEEEIEHARGRRRVHQSRRVLDGVVFGDRGEGSVGLGAFAGACFTPIPFAGDQLHRMADQDAASRRR